jgi:hypothetical protein
MLSLFKPENSFLQLLIVAYLQTTHLCVILLQGTLLTQEKQDAEYKKEYQAIKTLQTQKILFPFLYAESSPVRGDVRTGVDDLFRSNLAVEPVDFY